MSRYLDQNTKRELKRYYDLLRTQAEKDHADNLARLYERFPELKEFDEKRTALNLAVFRAELIPDSDQVKTLAEDLAELDQQKNRFLQEHDIPGNYQEIKYHCPICSDRGWVDHDYCRCSKKIILDLNRQGNSFAPPRDLKFQNFRADIFSDQKKSQFFQGKISPRMAINGIKEWLINYCRNFEHEKSNLYFFGTPGTGKTFMMASVANQLIEQGYYVVYLDADELFKRFAEHRILLNSFEPDPVKMDISNGIMDLLRHCDLLCIDDLGIQGKGLINAKSDLISLINQRYEDHLPIIMTSNLTPRDLGEEYDARIRSRITGNYELTIFEGEDIRKRIARAKYEIPTGGET